MGIREFIRDDVFAPRLCAGVLVVYDPEHRYRGICRDMAGEQVTLVDASDGSIESREAALAAVTGMAKDRDGHRGLLIYVPATRPLSDEAKQIDPFSIYAELGAAFPDGDGTSYFSLCLRAKPDHATEIRQLFEHDASPAFELIDNIGGGLKWPTLRTLLGVESGRDILLALLVPTAAQKRALQGNEAWLAEARALLEGALGLKPKTRGKTWSSLADELWRFLLFSEFRFDLPGDLPPALGDVPCAPPVAKEVVEDLCDALRADARHRPEYVRRAEELETELGLPAACAAIEDLGLRDTFPFEERTVLTRAVRALSEDRLDDVRTVIQRRERSVWIEKGESREQWDLLAAALALVEACDDAARLLPGHIGNLGALVDHYVASLRRVDQLQREFEQAVGTHLSPDGLMSAVVEQARRAYGRLMGKVQLAFTRNLEATGWPPPGRLANAEVFDKHVAPVLQESGRRVAYIMVDALRYELGVALHGQIGDGAVSTIIPACSQFPTVTSVGMASLLPGASAGLRLAKNEGGFLPELDGVRLTSVAQRMEVLQARYGDRFAEHPLASFVKAKPAIPETVSLLVLRDSEIDAHLEQNPESTLMLLPGMLKRIRVALQQLETIGFNDVVIATDHGFFLNAQAEAGDLCGRPPGAWLTIHDRSLLGEGAGDAANFAISAERVGIRGEFGMFAGPRSMAPYRRGVLYFHGGASLQEAVVPVITVRLKKPKQPALTAASVSLSYRRSGRTITTRRPVIEVRVESTDIFSQAAELEMLLEAQDKKGTVVGEVKPGGMVNAATGTITLRPGQTEQVTLRMADEFSGKFTVKALNPTTLTTFATLDLETDYAV